MTEYRQSRLYNWCYETFGQAVANSPNERAARVVEEAIELAQAIGVDRKMIDAIADRVYSRPFGDIKQEIAGTAFTLDVLAFLFDVNVDQVVWEELDRVSQIPKENFRAKHKEKVDVGASLIPSEV